MNVSCVGELNVIILTEKGQLYFEEFWFLMLSYSAVINYVFLIVIYARMLLVPLRLPMLGSEGIFNGQ
jgi:hypothetical protein